MRDISYRAGDWSFSYRVAGICEQGGRVLLQRPDDDDGYAFPGGQVAFGETNEQTLVREFREEINADVTVGALRWVAEIFIPLGDRELHQICLYYDVTIDSPEIPREGSFIAHEDDTRGGTFDIRYYWIPLDEVRNIKVYPENAVPLLSKRDGAVEHFVYREPR